MTTGALIIFVKTPGFSPIKTRLAAEVGDDTAAQFYLSAIKKTESLAMEAMKRCPGLIAYWAVAEPAGIGHNIWRNFSNLWQGDGSLGERMSYIYDQAIARHDYVCFLGADSPHLSADVLCEGILKTSWRKNFVLGPALDGGFYFFGGSIPLPKELWTCVNYSKDSTARELRESFYPLGEFDLLPENFDIDTAQDLKKYNALVTKGV
ncbi:MAG: DUF2064 domain-containing protein [Bdellovibrionales bacterium]|nr:DUF2064 domain-containing protein [Bdellovibrionales bacterium]